VPEEINDLLKSGVFGECVYVETLVAQDASITVDEANA
jgi:hypothetical protein